MGDNQSQSCDFLAQSNSPGTECEALAYLMKALNQRPEKSLLLSDLGALLPDSLRVAVRESGGLRTCVQKFPIFKVTGQPGRERVTLLLGAAPEVAYGENAAPSEPAPELNITRGFEDDDSDEKDRSIVQLRGLPYRATEDDVRKFLGTHLVHVKDESGIRLLLSRDGRPSGFARVQFSCPLTARAACQDLHERVMYIDADNVSGAGSSSRQRYVEVFLHSEHPNKARFQKSSSLNGCPENVDPALEAEAAQISPDQIANEVRQYMGQDSKGELLLSMLGVALSPAARLYLRKADRGVKRLLAQYPNEFVISGEKGRERITYVPNQDCRLSLTNALAFGTTSVSKFADSKPQTEPCTQLDADDFDVRPSTTPKILCSPDAGEFRKLAMSPSFFRTPSNWGTPDVNQGSRLESAADMFADDQNQMMQTMWAPFPLSFNPPPPPDPRSSSDTMQPVKAQAAPPMIRLRGLSFDTTKQEVCSLFSHHGLVDRISDECGSIQMLTKSNGQPSGEAKVQLRRAEDVAVVNKVLQNTTLGSRYIEVLPYQPAGSQAPSPQLRQDSAAQVQQLQQLQLNVAVQSAPPPVMAGGTLYSDAWLFSQLAAVAQCSPEHNSYNAGFNLLPGEACRQGPGLRV